MKDLKKSSKAPNRTDTDKTAVLKKALAGALICIISLTVLLCAFSALCLLFDEPHKFVFALCLLSLCFSAFIGGFFTVKQTKGRYVLPSGLLCGTFIAIAYFIVFSLLDIAFSLDRTPGFSLIYDLFVIPVSLFGAFVGAGGSNTNRPKRRKK